MYFSPLKYLALLSKSALFLKIRISQKSLPSLCFLTPSCELILYFALPIPGFTLNTFLPSFTDSFTDSFSLTLFCQFLSQLLLPFSPLLDILTTPFEPSLS
jgi:hypothetical protein